MSSLQSRLHSQLYFHHNLDSDNEIKKNIKIAINCAGLHTYKMYMTENKFIHYVGLYTSITENKFIHCAGLHTYL